ncbi:hypothetical protein PGUG_05195 [Meyerozyma guilliermondii ATCC 6260]|uniref:Uncharacterized protein n=1 Tax=Meyerozyma guilliermondii (strain ATCC 6260 / CBS 566 / DSM 6381 / JCM 1539 / NBRC 10279 / NRRL Y-324) TaxID=294746 RepID=A5DPJ4_PICGU|nr:uncharacterized protein PGUG_05195 [Meyerozyma guilliermondii ATCC 6260]EDK41097.2 hypothetical protein PGUG_05195 [Meyerozyma guilliermondii ATCC 6260]
MHACAACQLKANCKKPARGAQIHVAKSFCSQSFSSLFRSMTSIDLDTWGADVLQYGVLIVLLSLCSAFFFFYFRVWHLVTREKQVVKSKSQLLTVVIAALIVCLNLQLWYRFSESFHSSDTIANYSVLHAKLTSFNVTGYSFAEANSPKQIKDFQCDSVKFTDTLFVTEPTPFSSSLKRIRDELSRIAQDDYPIAENCFLDKEGEDEKSILAHKWFHFCGSSVWLEKYQVHFMVSRVLYTHRGTRNKPTINMIYMQVFDKNWVEQFDVKLGDSDTAFPSILKVDIDQSPNTAKHRLALMGPEDPRVSVREFYKDGELQQEPVVIFNMRSTKIKWFRAMHMCRPLSDGKTVRLSLRDRAPEFREKNWAPFFDKNDPKKVFFVYNFNPLRIIGCSLDKGICDKLAGPEFGEDSKEHVGSLRGGTNLVPIPSEVLPESLQNRMYWFGIARSHSSQCGCLGEIYRPHLFIISKGENDYAMDYISSLVDFNIRTEPWNPSKSICDDGKSVLIPNSISYWDVGDEERMGIVFSEADRTNKIIHVNGMMKHVLNVLNNGRNVETDERKKENALLGRCSTSKVAEYCESTAKKQHWNMEPPKNLHEVDDDFD